MFEYNSTSVAKLDNVCFGCLTNTKGVRPIAVDDFKSYIDYVKVDLPEVAVSMCVLCTHLLRRTNAFVKQCRQAGNIIEVFIRQNSKSEHKFRPMKHLYNLTRSVTHTEKYENNAQNHAIEDSLDDNDMFVDDEDIPLTMLKTDDLDLNVNGKRRARKKKKRKKWNKEANTEVISNRTAAKLDNNIKVPQEIEADRKIDVFLDVVTNDLRCEDAKAESVENVMKKRKKVLRDGFTPRMVQETEEYTVIKLSKEQVLKEMSENVRSEKYQRFLYKCDACVKGFNFEDVLRTHMERHENKKGWLECDLCHQFCPNVVSFRGHMKSHTTRYKCKVCGCVRLSRQVLLEHHASSHTSEAVRYTCQHCEFVSSKRTSMQRHVRTRHNKTEKHPCEMCGKLLNSLEGLRVHTTRHDKSKRVKCDQCDRWFVYRSLLQRHQAAVHLRGDYYCVECDRRFKSRENLSLHFKRHRRHRDVSTFKYECEHCRKKFVFLSSLSYHLSSSHGVKRDCVNDKSRREVKNQDVPVLPEQVDRDIEQDLQS